MKNSLPNLIRSSKTIVYHPGSKDSIETLHENIDFRNLTRYYESTTANINFNNFTGADSF